MKHHSIVSGLLALSLSVTASGALAFEELGKVELAPMAEPTKPLNVGDEWHWIRNGKPYSDSVTAVDGGQYSAKNSLGCSWTNLNYRFAPSLVWENCNGSSGTQKITKAKGSPWPLQHKHKFKYSFTGKNAKGDTWKAQRACKVKKQVRVKVPAGEFDTFKVVCSDPWSVRTWWVSPEYGGTVAWKRDHKTDNSRDAMQELVKRVVAE